MTENYNLQSIYSGQRWKDIIIYRKSVLLSVNSKILILNKIFFLQSRIQRVTTNNL